MAYRNVYIANGAKLSTKNSQLIVNNGELFSFPIEDVRSVVVESQNVTITSQLLSQLSENGVCVIICNSQHLPSAVLTPINGFSRQNRRIELQFNQSVPMKKRLWQSVVTAKIRNQAKCLEYTGNSYEKLVSISNTVLSGDTTNREAYAANLYFKTLFGSDFYRDDESTINAALNYGYSIIRSYIARTLTVYGLEPSLGIHHKNEYNNFNLADDLIEPFRPVIDLYVFENFNKEASGFSTAEKAGICRLMNAAIYSNGERHSVAFAIERLVQSLVYSFENAVVQLKLPEITKTSFFDYD